MDLTKPQDSYEALYLCAAITIPEHRKKGYASSLMIEVINSIPHNKGVKLFAWPYSKDGEEVIKKLSNLLKVDILIKKK